MSTPASLTPPPRPLISGTGATIAGALSLALVAIAPVLPTVGVVDLGTVAGILALIAAGLAGLALPRLTFGTHAPIVPQALVPLCLSALPILQQVAAATTGALHLGLVVLGLVVAWLAGAAAPQPTHTEAP